MLMLNSMIMLMSVSMLTSMLMLMLTKLPSNKTPELGADFGRILDHFGDIFGDFWGSRRLPKSEFERETVVHRFLVVFGGLLGPSWGPCCPKVGLQNFLKCIFLFFLPFQKTTKFQRPFDIALGPSWDRLGTVLGSILRGFWGPKSMSTTTWRKYKKWAPVEARAEKSRFGGYRVSIKNWYQSLFSSMLTKCSQNLPKSLPKWSQDRPKRAPKWGQNLTST